MRAPALAAGDTLAHLDGFWREPGFGEGVVEVPDVADFPLHLAERDGAFGIQDPGDRTRVALVDHPLGLERFELRLARRDLEVSQDRAVAVEARPVGAEKFEGPGVLRGGQAPDRRVGERWPEELEGVEVDL